MKYQDFRKKEQEAFNKLPIFYAFGHKQFKEALEARGVKYEEAPQKVVSIGCGGYFLKKDKPVIDDFFSKDFSGELRKIMENDLEFARDAFEYEMANHEYPINLQGDYDVCSCFGNVEWDEMKDGIDYLKEIGFSEPVIAEYRKAVAYIYDTMDY